MSVGFGYLGPYRLLNCVHTGQTSRLWQAYDDRARKYVAVKTLLDNYRRDREQVQLLKWEYAVGHKLSSELVVNIERYGKDHGSPYLMMEWFAAPNLKQRINRGLDTYAAILPEIIAGMADSVAYLNSTGWIHRDVKPDNFLVADDGTTKLLDFALARREKRGIAKLFAGKGKPQGTASYMSPEQIRGKAVDSRSDVYSLGCAMYELLAGRPPFTGVSVSDLLNKHLRAAPPPVTIANGNVTPELSSLLQQAMAKDPARRPESSQKFAKLVKNTRPLRRVTKKVEE